MARLGGGVDLPFQRRSIHTRRQPVQQGAPVGQTGCDVAQGDLAARQMILRHRIGRIDGDRVLERCGRVRRFLALRLDHHQLTQVGPQRGDVGRHSGRLAHGLDRSRQVAGGGLCAREIGQGLDLCRPALDHRLQHRGHARGIELAGIGLHPGLQPLSEGLVAEAGLAQQHIEPDGQQGRDHGGGDHG